MKSRKRLITLLVGVGVLALLIGVYFGVQKKAADYEAAQTSSTETLLSMTADQVAKISYTTYKTTDSSASDAALSSAASASSAESTASSEKTALSFTRKDGTWTYDQDASFDLDQDACDTLASGVTGIAVYQKMTGVTDLSQYGLDQPTTVATLTDTDGKTVKITIGNTDSATSDTYVYLDDDKTTVYACASSIGTDFQKTESDFKAASSTASGTTAESAASTASASVAS